MFMIQVGIFRCARVVVSVTVVLIRIIKGMLSILNVPNRNRTDEKTVKKHNNNQ